MDVRGRQPVNTGSKFPHNGIIIFRWCQPACILRFTLWKPILNTILIVIFAIVKQKMIQKLLRRGIIQLHPFIAVYIKSIVVWLDKTSISSVCG